MDYIYLLLAICSIIIVIAFPIINAVKKRNQANMHLFDNVPEGKEQQKKHSSSFIMESAVVAAIVYLIMFFIVIMKGMFVMAPTVFGEPTVYPPIIRVTAAVSVVIIFIKWICRKRGK